MKKSNNNTPEATPENENELRDKSLYWWTNSLDMNKRLELRDKYFPDRLLLTADERLHIYKSEHPSPVPDSSKDALKDAQRNACLVALEFGYIQCEKGNNLEMAILNYNKIVNQQ